jgi:hypothetical protein
MRWRSPLPAAGGPEQVHIQEQRAAAHDLQQLSASLTAAPAGALTDHRAAPAFAHAASAPCEANDGGAGDEPARGDGGSLNRRRRAQAHERLRHHSTRDRRRRGWRRRKRWALDGSDVNRVYFLGVALVVDDRLITACLLVLAVWFLDHRNESRPLPRRRSGLL